MNLQHPNRRNYDTEAIFTRSRTNIPGVDLTLRTLRRFSSGRITHVAAGQTPLT